MITPAPLPANDIHAALDRMEASFGAEAIRDLLILFDAQLAEASAALDTGTAVPIAHRIAGVAGTLGFMTLGRVWARIADGDDSAVDEARRMAPAAHAIIAQRTRNAPAPPTSV